MPTNWTDVERAGFSSHAPGAGRGDFDPAPLRRRARRVDRVRRRAALRDPRHPELLPGRDGHRVADPEELLGHAGRASRQRVGAPAVLRSAVAVGEALGHGRGRAALVLGPGRNRDDPGRLRDRGAARIQAGGPDHGGPGHRQPAPRLVLAGGPRLRAARARCGAIPAGLRGGAAGARAANGGALVPRLGGRRPDALLRRLFDRGGSRDPLPSLAGPPPAPARHAQGSPRLARRCCRWPSRSGAAPSGSRAIPCRTA